MSCIREKVDYLEQKRKQRRDSVCSNLPGGSPHAQEFDVDKNTRFGCVDGGRLLL